MKVTPYPTARGLFFLNTQGFTLVTILVNPITNLICLSLILCLLTHP